MSFRGLLILALASLPAFSSAADRALSPEEAFTRASAVLEYFGAPPEADPQPFLEDLQRIQTSDAIKRVLPFMDLANTFSRYVAFDADSGLISVFQDVRSRKVPDYSVYLAPDGRRSFNPDFARRLRAAKMNPRNQPLQGLRIALDPGHMGGEVWDRRTGKVIRANDGRVLSEGVIALQTALLLERDLRALGAEVLVTRRTLDPVTPLEFERFDLREYAVEELRESQQLDWFQRLLTKAPAGETLYRAFRNSAEVRRLFSEEMRIKYFMQRADLAARVELIQRFSPDLTLIIHFDTMNAGPRGGVNPGSYDATKAYVSGAFERGEFASRDDRKYFARHILDPVTWNASVLLSQSLVSSIGTQLRLRPDASGGSLSTRRISPGVYSRNLHLNRKLTGAPVSYLECLFYNDPFEFDALLTRDFEMTIGGRVYPYSNRLLSVAGALRDGITNFVRAF